MAQPSLFELADSRGTSASMSSNTTPG
jgi:hypothetical protein